MASDGHFISLPIRRRREKIPVFRANEHRQSQISTAQAARLGLRAYKNLLSIALVKK